MPVGDSDIWPDIVGTRGGKSKLEITEDWNMNKGMKESEILDNQTI